MGKMKGIDNEAVVIELEDVKTLEDVSQNGQVLGNSVNTENVTVEADAGKLYTYDVFENPNILMAIGCAMQVCFR